MADDAKFFAPSQICDAQYRNQMDDGTTIIGLDADFVYTDNSKYNANAKNLSVKYGEEYHLYSENKCVKSGTFTIAARRPGGQIELKSGTDPDAPAGKCRIRTVWILRPVSLIDESFKITDNVPFELVPQE